MHCRLEHGHSLKREDFGNSPKSRRGASSSTDAVRTKPFDIELTPDEKTRVGELRRRRMLTDEELRTRASEDSYDARFGAKYLDARSEIDVGQRIGKSEAEAERWHARAKELEDQLRDRDREDDDAAGAESEEIADLSRALEKRDELLLEQLKQSHEKEMLMLKMSHEKEIEMSRQIREAELGKFKAEMLVELEKVKGESKAESFEQALVHQASKGIERLADMGEKLGTLVVTGGVKPLSESPGMRPPPARDPKEPDIIDLMDPKFVRTLPDGYESPGFRDKGLEGRKEET